jgi:hypothetical protein
VTPGAPPRWSGPEPHARHRLLLAACCHPANVAQAAWQQWLGVCQFDDEDPGSFELAGLAVARLGADAGTGSIVARCRGWNRRAWLLTTLASEVAAQLRDHSQRQGIDMTPVGDLRALEVGLRFAGRPFPVRRLEFHVHHARRDVLEALRQVAMRGTAHAAIQSGRLPLSLRTDYRYPPLTHAAGRIVWLLSRNWRRYPIGRVRWVLELMAEVNAVADAHALGAEVADHAQRFGTLAAVREALEWMERAALATDRLRSILQEVSARPCSLLSHARLWRARHPWTPHVMRRA